MNYPSSKNQIYESNVQKDRNKLQGLWKYDVNTKSHEKRISGRLSTSCKKKQLCCFWTHDGTAGWYDWIQTLFSLRDKQHLIVGPSDKQPVMNVEIVRTNVISETHQLLSDEPTSSEETDDSGDGGQPESVLPGDWIDPVFMYFSMRIIYESYTENLKLQSSGDIKDI